MRTKKYTVRYTLRRATDLLLIDKEKSFNEDSDVNNYIKELKKHRRGTDLEIIGKPIIICNQIKNNFTIE